LTRVNLLSERDGRSKGIGFVGFATKDDAEEALKKANGEEFEGR
jgi:RNA recognition motif-containing protein